MATLILGQTSINEDDKDITSKFLQTLGLTNIKGIVRGSNASATAGDLMKMKIQSAIKDSIA